jgi:hypothetical protein
MKFKIDGVLTLIKFIHGLVHAFRVVVFRELPVILNDVCKNGLSKMYIAVIYCLNEMESTCRERPRFSSAGDL